MSIDAAAEFWTKVDNDAAFQEDLFNSIKMADGDEIVEFAKQHGFDFTVEDLRELSEASDKEELSDDDLENVAGGVGFSRFTPGRTSRFLFDKLHQGFFAGEPAVAR